MKKILICIFLFGCCFKAYSHPAWGIITDEQGNIYFADLSHNEGTIWKYDVKGRLTALKKNTHVHNLINGRNGSFFAAELQWRTGEIEGEGHNYLYEIHPDGKTDTLIFSKDWNAYFGSNVALDSKRNVYFNINEKIFRRTITGEPVAIDDRKYKSISSIFVDEKDNLWFIEKNTKNGTLYKWNESEKTTEFISGFKNPAQETVYYFGLKNNGSVIYVTEFYEGKILAIDENKKITSYYQSASPWKAINLAFYGDTAYILELDDKNNDVRIIQKDKTGNTLELVNVATYKEPIQINEFAVPEKPNNFKTGFHWLWLALLSVGIFIYLKVKKKL